MRLWTAERDAVLARRWPAGDESDAIIAELNALEGAQFHNSSQLGYRAKRLGARRPDWYLRERARRGGATTAAKVAAGLIKPPRFAFSGQPQNRGGWSKSAPKPARPKGAPQATTATKSPTWVYEWKVRQEGARLGLPLDLRGDVEAVNDALRREDPAHPGLRLLCPPSLHRQYFQERS